MTETRVPVRSTRRIPRLKISDALARELGELAIQAASQRKNRPINPEDDAAIFLHAIAGQTVEEAINHYVSQKAFEIPLTGYRDAVKPKGDLAAAIEGLLRQLPADEETVPFAQIRRLYCYGNPDWDGLDVDETKKENLWAHQLSPAAVTGALKQWLQLLGELHKMAGKGRPPITAQRDFVQELAGWWRREVLADNKARLGSSRADHRAAKPPLRDQRGRFATFVQTAAQGIPDSKFLNWDQAIREISEQTP